MKSLLALVAALILAPSTGFSFAHFWQIQEIYSNSDGSVQFIELHDDFNSEEFLSNSQIRFNVNSAPVNSLTFNNSTATDGTGDLPSGTAGHTFLIATANFNALFGIVPDYIIPANFLSKGAQNTIFFGPSSDTVSLANLPTDGVMSLDGKIASGVVTDTAINNQASPKNFAGVTKMIPEPTGAILVGAGLLTGILFLRNRRGFPSLR